MALQKPDPYFDLIMDEDLAVNEWPKKLDVINKFSKQKSLMAKIMTEEIFNSLKHHKTKHGWTIARAINTGVMNPTSMVGCHVGDAESYRDFAPLFRPLIEKYHSGFNVDTKKHVTSMDVDKVTIELADQAKNRIVSTRIRCARNLSLFPLNTIGTKETRLEISALMEKVFTTLPWDLKGSFFKHCEMSARDMDTLINEHFLFKGKDKMQAASGYHTYWPHGRGVFVSDDRKFIVWVNEGDHLRIISLENSDNIKQVFGRFVKAVTAIEDGLKQLTGRDNVFLSDEVLGMITCCPSNLGTCLRGSVLIQIPKLINSAGLDGINEIAHRMNCQARGTYGEHSAVIDCVDISNRRRLGFPEHELINDMINCVNSISALENSLL